MLKNLAHFLSDAILLDETWHRKLATLSTTDISPDVKGLLFDAPCPRMMAEKQCAAASSSGASTKKIVAVLPVHGIIEQHGSWFSELMGGTSTDALSSAIDLCMNEPRIGSILLDFHSPGGTPFGVKELADKIYSARSEKLIVSMSNSMMCSAAAWLGAAADRSFVSPMSMNASIGVYSAHLDESGALEKEGIKATVFRIPEAKAELHPFEPLKPEAAAAEMAAITEIYEEFVSSMARYRGTTAEDVKANYGNGRTMSAKAAVSAGLADGILSMDELVERLSAGRVRRQSSGAAAIVDEELPRLDARDLGKLRRRVSMMGLE